MTRKKKFLGASLVRSSAAESLTFVAASGGGGVEAVCADENMWLSQKMMAQLHGEAYRRLRASGTEHAPAEPEVGGVAGRRATSTAPIFDPDLAGHLCPLPGVTPNAR